jgi:hypothetical protein
MFYKIGAALYALWGVLHLLAAVEGYRLAATVEAGAVQGRLMQNAWNIGFFALVALVVAVTMNWHNSTTGYWINLIAVSAADIGFILFVLLPGHIALWPGVLGPVVWILAVVFSTIGFTMERAV